MKTMTRRVPLALSLLCCAAPALGQEHLEITGVLRGSQGQRLEVQSDERRWIVVVDSERIRSAGQRTQFEFHGRGRGSIIRASWWVRFFADVDATGKVVGPLRSLTWFTPQRGNQEGAFPAEPREEGEPLVHFDRPQRGEMKAGHYLIVGSIKSLRQGQIVVVFEGRQVLAELAPDIDVEINITNKLVVGELLKVGDAVEVQGRLHENQLHALLVVARREEVLGKPLPSPRAPRRGNTGR